ncbi:MAG TPA: type II secretion system protein [Sedimentisphaerales bacterium]|nr:type II secretion system protein [Sedimentisphaerales bacterium]HRS13083.1 type II secretion system protein [Sedimentisphaerales bacterium]HRV46421.1 type II secretion system protein [Sedimentisphaerales bacterium]
MRKSKAFTLIELLVVIAVIAVLMGILIPALGKARELAQGAACKGNLKNYTIAMAMYLDDNDRRFAEPQRCYFSQLTPYPVEAGISEYLHLRWCNGDIELKSHPEYGGMMARYLGDARAFICPTFKNLAVRHSDDQFFLAYGKNVKNYEPWYNYTMNAYLGSARSDVQETRVLKDTDVKHPATTFSFAEESAIVDTAYNMSGLNDTFMAPGSDTMVKSWFSQTGGDLRRIIPGPEGVGQFWDVIAGFHHAPSGDKLGGRGNCAFLDGHVEAFSRAETFYYAYPKK